MNSWSVVRTAAAPPPNEVLLGRTLGFPTANLPLDDDTLEDGVWVALARHDGGHWIPAAVPIGRRRTFYPSGGPRLLEAHLLDFQGDLYGVLLEVYLLEKIRGQEHFPTAEALIDQVHRDVQVTRERVQMYRAHRALEGVRMATTHSG